MIVNYICSRVIFTFSVKLIQYKLAKNLTLTISSWFFGLSFPLALLKVEEDEDEGEKKENEHHTITAVTAVPTVTNIFKELSICALLLDKLAIQHGQSGFKVADLEGLTCKLGLDSLFVSKQVKEWIESGIFFESSPRLLKKK